MVEPANIGPYKVLRRLGSGGQADVYLCEKTDQDGQIDDDRIAIKLLRSKEDSHVKRFLREVHTQQLISHKNVVKIMDRGKHDGFEYAVMEYLPSVLNEQMFDDEVMLPDHVANILYQVALGLGSAHELGVIHRDIKPHNIMLTADQSPKLTDFGIARVSDLSTMTQVGTVMGTPHYMSPEQALGERATPGSDVYSLGCVMYEMLTGRVPFRADTPAAVMEQHRTQNAISVREYNPDISNQLRRVVEKCLEKRAELRYANAVELAEAIRHATPEAITEQTQVIPDQVRTWVDEVIEKAEINSDLEDEPRISRIEAEFIAIEHARRDQSSYPDDLVQRGLGFEIIEAPTSDENGNFIIELAFQPSTFIGRPGRERFEIDSRGKLLSREIIREPQLFNSDTNWIWIHRSLSATITLIMLLIGAGAVFSIESVRCDATDIFSWQFPGCPDGTAVLTSHADPGTGQLIFNLNSNSSVAFKTGIQSIGLQGDDRLSTAKIIVAEASLAEIEIDLPEPLTRQEPRLMNISLDESDPAMVNEASIDFYVPSSWLAAEGIEAKDVALYRFVSNVWIELPTTLTSSDIEMLNFRAITPGFSYFLVSGSSVILDEIKDISGIGGLPVSIDFSTVITTTVEISAIEIDWGDGSEKDSITEESEDLTLALASHNYSEQGDYSGTFTVTTDSGLSKSGNFMSVISPPPIVAPTINSITCTTSTINVGDSTSCVADVSGTIPFTYEWSVSGASPSPTTGGASTFSPTFAGTSTGTVSLTVTNPTGSDSESATVTVNPLPPTIDSITCAPLTFMKGGSTSCTASVSGTAPFTYEWSASGSSPSPASGSESSFTATFNGTPTGTISLTVTNSAGSDSEGAVVTVNPIVAPTIDSVTCMPTTFATGGPTSCSTSVSGTGPITYEWSASGANPTPVAGSESTFTPTFNGTGTGTISLTITNSAGTASDSVTVTVDPHPPTIISITCTPVTFVTEGSTSCTTSVSGTAPFTYAWTAWDANPSPTTGNASTFSPKFSGTGIGTVSLIVTNSAGNDSESASVTVNPLPPTINSLTCAPSRIITGNSTECSADISGTGPFTYAWAASGASPSPATGSASTFSPTFTGIPSSEISLTVTNSAGSNSKNTTITVDIEVVPPKIDSITCTPATIIRGSSTSCSTSVSGTAPFTYEWSASGASPSPTSSSSPTFTLVFNGTPSAAISLTVRNSAGNDTADVTIIVNPPPTPPTINSITCTPATFVAQGSTSCSASVSGTQPIAYVWTASGASPSPATGSASVFSPGFSGTGAGSISLTVTNVAGSDSDGTTVTVNPPPVPPTIDSITCAPSTFNTGESTNCSASVSGTTPFTYAWTASGADPSPTSGSSPTFVPTFNGTPTGTISLTVTNIAGADSDGTTVTVNQLPPTIISITCTPATFTTGGSTSCSAGVSGTQPITYAWTASGASPTPTTGSATTFGPTFNGTGTGTVSLAVTNVAGADSGETTVTVNAIIPPTINSITCSPSAFNTGSSTSCSASVSGTAPFTYAWTASGASPTPTTGSAATFDPAFNGTGTGTISLTVANSAGPDSDSTDVTVTPLPPSIISISCTPSSFTPGNSTNCSATVSGTAPFAYDWSASGASPSPTTGSASTFSPTFNASGTGTISLTVTNSAGSDSDSTDVTVNNSPIVNSFSVSKSFDQLDWGITVTDLDTSDVLAYEIRWASGDVTAGSISVVERNGNQQYTKNGIFDEMIVSGLVLIQVTDDVGAVGTKTYSCDFSGSFTADCFET